MVYISNGAVVNKRSPWRLSLIVDFVLGIVSMFTIFLRTLYDPAAVAAVQSGAGSSRNNRRDGSGRGGGGGSGRPRIMGLDTLNKADHNARCGGGG